MLSRVESNAQVPSQVIFRRSHFETGVPSCAYVLLANFSNETIVVPKATVLGVAEEISESLIDRINPKCKSELDTPVIPQRQKKNEAFYGKLLQGMLDHLSQDEGQLIERILLKYTHVFHDESTNDFKRTDFVEYQILVGDTPHISRPQYCTPYALR